MLLALHALYGASRRVLRASSPAPPAQATTASGDGTSGGPFPQSASNDGQPHGNGPEVHAWTESYEAAAQR